MQDVITMMDNEPRVSSKHLAEGFEVAHTSVQKMMLKYRAEMEQLGKVVEVATKNKRSKAGSNRILNPVGYEVGSGGKDQIDYYLNEQQATFFGQLTRNSEVSVKFKLSLTKEFFAMRNKLQNLKAHQSTEEWQAARVEGKAHRRTETDAIKKLVDYAKSQGSKNADRYYANITKVENAALFVIAGTYENLRDVMSSKQLFQIACADQLVEKAVNEGIAKGLPYKDVFQLVKADVHKFGALMGKSDVIARQLALIGE